MKIKFLLLFTFIGFIVFTQTMNETITNFKIENILEKIPFGSEKSYGFSFREEFKQCTLGKPIGMITIGNDQKLQELNQWRIPVIHNGSHKTLLTIQKVNGKYEVVDIGGNQLSVELQKFENKGLQVSYLLRLYSQGIDFVSTSKDIIPDATIEFVPLESAQNYLNLKGIQKQLTYNFNDIIKLSTK